MRSIVCASDVESERFGFEGGPLELSANLFPRFHLSGGELDIRIAAHPSMRDQAGLPIGEHQLGRPLKLEAQLLGELRTQPGQVLVGARAREIIDDRDALARSQQRGGQVAADEACAAGDEYAHG